MRLITSLMAALPRGGALPDEQWAQRHRGILTLLWLHAVGVPCFGLLNGNGAFLSINAGLTIAAIAAVASLTMLSRNARAAITTVGLMTATALLVHLSGGYIELHFHFFVLMAVIALYQDWLPFLVALLSIVVEHGLMGMMQPFQIYNHPAAQHHPWTWAIIHGAFILAESAALLVYWSVNESARYQYRESEQRTNSIVDSAFDAVVVIDDHGLIIEWNPQAERTFGWSRAEAVGRLLSQVIIPPQYREAHENGLRTYLATGEGPILRKRIEITALRRNGTEFPVELAIIPLRLDWGTAFSAFIRDITERQQAERELLRSKDAAEVATVAKSQFLANISHEIRTPMNGVLGMTELLLASTIDGRQRHLAESIQRSGENLMAVINNVLDFSKIEAGKLTLEQLDFDVQETVEETVEFLANPAQHKGLELTCQMLGPFQRTLRGDPVRLRQALLNLLGNAIKFTAQGEIKVLVEAVGDTPDAVTLRFAVKDSGIGVAVESQARIFEAFSQADGTTTRRFGGTGLGLAIVKDLVTLMQGQIGVESRPGNGSTFWFTAVFQRQSCAIHPAQEQKQPLVRTKILVVDDTSTNREILEDHLQSWGVTPTMALSGQEALTYLQAAVDGGQPFNVAILDLHMPDMDGLMLAQAIRSDQRLAGLRLMMLTSVGYDASGPGAPDVDSWVTKPIRKSLLRQALLGISQEAPRIEPPPKSERLPIAQPAQADCKHILLVEDTPVNREVAIGMLELLGHRVDVAENGQEAVDAIAQRRFDLVLMDCQMPVMDGFAATGAIRERERSGGDTGRLPIIALTAHAVEGDRERCLAAGMDNYLTKPFTLQSLQDMLAQWIPASSLTSGPATAAPSGPPSEPDRPTAPVPTVIDETAWEAIRALQRPDRPNILHKALALYLTHSQVLVDQLQHDIATHDLLSVHATAHTIKSSSAQLGAHHLAQLCKEVETTCRAGIPDHLPALVARLITEHQDVCAAMRSAINKEMPHAA